jgi:hypothetical protein
LVAVVGCASTKRWETLPRRQIGAGKTEIFVLTNDEALHMVDAQYHDPDVATKAPDRIDGRVVRAWRTPERVPSTFDDNGASPKEIADRAQWQDLHRTGPITIPYADVRAMRMRAEPTHEPSAASSSAGKGLAVVMVGALVIGLLLLAESQYDGRGGIGTC